MGFEGESYSPSTRLSTGNSGHGNARVAGTSLTGSRLGRSNMRFFNTFFVVLGRSAVRDRASASPERTSHETHLSALYRPSQAYPRLPCPHENQGWPRRHQCAPRQGSRTSGCLIDASPNKTGRVRLRDARLVNKADFDRVFADNQRARTDYVMVMARPNQAGCPRLGMIVAKRLLARAVDRNRVKRCIRESFRQVLAELPACDFVVRLIAKPVPGDEARDLSRTFKRAGQRAMAKWPTSPAGEAAPEPPTN